MGSDISFCPFCGGPLWGEGWIPATGERYFSHKDGKGCCHELGFSPNAIKQYGVLESTKTDDPVLRKILAETDKN